MKYLIANWKSYITDRKEANSLFLGVKKTIQKNSGCKVIICPPYPFLSDASESNLTIGAQDVFWEKNGAYTGEVTLDMLKNLNVEYVILGHSERRAYLGETDDIINKKLKAALKAGFKVVLCVGEKQRKEPNVIPSVVADQVKAAFLDIPKSKVCNVVVAYEPIWAIGTGLSDTPDNAYQAALYIKKTIGKIYNPKIGTNIKFLYGGSVNSKNILDFISHHGIDGVLVGSASTKKEEFAKMIKLVG